MMSKLQWQYVHSTTDITPRLLCGVTTMLRHKILHVSIQVSNSVKILRAIPLSLYSQVRIYVRKYSSKYTSSGWITYHFIEIVGWTNEWKLWCCDLRRKLIYKITIILFDWALIYVIREYYCCICTFVTFVSLIVISTAKVIHCFNYKQLFIVI